MNVLNLLARKPATPKINKIQVMSAQEVKAFHRTSFPTMSWGEFCDFGFATAGDMAKDGRDNDARVLRDAIARAENAVLR